jgi:hypothetical protein
MTSTATRAAAVAICAVVLLAMTLAQLSDATTTQDEEES